MLDIVLVALIIGGTISVVLLPKKRKCYGLYILILAFQFLDVGRAKFVFYMLPIIFTVLAIVCTYFLTKKPRIWLYLIVPVILTGFLWYYFKVFVGVINPRLPVLISTITLVLSMLLTVKLSKAVWRIVINSSLAAVIVVSMALCPLHAFTYAEGKELLSKELDETVSSAHTKIVLSKAPGIYMDCIDYLYVFEVIDSESLTTYVFDPLTGKWAELD